MLSHYVSIGNEELMWQLGQSSSNSGEVISTIIVQKAASGLVPYRYYQLLLKDRQKDYSIADDIEKIVLYQL